MRLVLSKADPPPVRLLTRLSARYFLDSASVVADLFDGDLMLGLVFLAIAEANVSHVDEEAEGARDYAATPPPDSVRRGVTVYAVANSLGLTYETTRRHAKKLVERGCCVRTPQGYVVTAAALEQPEFGRGFSRNQANFEAFIGRLLRSGLLQAAAD